MKKQRLRPLSKGLDFRSEESTAWFMPLAKISHFLVSHAMLARIGILTAREHHDLNTTMSLAQFRETMRVNVEGAFLVCREWLRELPNCHKSMRNRSLIVFGSEAGIWGVDNVDYATSKAALHGLVQSFAADAVRKGGRVNLIAPGLVDTPQYQKEITETPALAWEGLATVVQGAPVPVADVARTCLYLASDNYSGSITAQTIRVDSGRSGRLYWPDSSSIA